MVHIFQCSPGQSGYQPVQSLPDHSAAVTAVKFAPSKDSGLQLLSSGADKSIIFHTLEKVRFCEYLLFNIFIGLCAYNIILNEYCDN